MINAYAAFEAKGELQPYQYDPGELRANEVEIKVDYCGICHSDLSMLDNEWGHASYPLVAGHEVVGSIAKVGSEVTGLQIGQAVGLGWQAGYCDNCGLCNAGDHNLCSKAQPTIIGRNGGFADKVRAAANSVVAIPEGLDLESAGPLFCGGITVFNPLVQYDIKPTDKVAVIGIGGLGHMALQFINAWGCEVTAFTTSESKKQAAMDMGAHEVLNTGDKQQMIDAAGRFDLIISTINVNLNWNHYLATLKARGRLHFVGAITEPLQIRISSLMGAQRSVSSSPVGSPATIGKMLEFARLHKIKPVIEKFSFEDINQAIDHLRNGDVKYRIVLHR
ncbi:MAG: NAD(P)-dependent alcohol dehydrogenase [Gammaproteobacteria bacterium]|nr:NAD(P)-dependent alcohol dehydrogenase [Gammaproteobacteria bacterium]